MFEERRQIVRSAKFTQHSRDRGAREHCGQRVGRPAFALVRFVEHGDVVRREQSAADREIEKEQRVIDDHEIGVFGLVAFGEVKAIAEALAVLADAFVGVGIELLPVFRRGKKAQFGPIAGARSIGPLPERLHRARWREQAIRPQTIQLLTAEVMRAPFEQRDPQRYVERALHERYVFADQLFLQCDRAGRKHHLLPAAHGRDDIGQRLADAGAGFHDRVHPLEDPALDQLRHLQLLGARLVPVEHSCEWTLAAEDLFERRGHGMRRCGSSGDSYSVSSSRPVAASRTTGATRRGGK